MKDWLDAKAIAGIVMGIGFMAQLLGFSLPTLKQANLNGEANIIARNAWNACEVEKDEIKAQRDQLWERLLDADDEGPEDFDFLGVP